MPAAIVGSSGDIAEAIDEFWDRYHDDFSQVRILGRQYVAAATADSVAARLAIALCDVLRRWGAGKRKAPELQGTRACETTLTQGPLHAALVALHNSPLPSLAIVDNQRSFFGLPRTQASLAAFDKSLFLALQALSAGLFHENTNATYPMKAALLITGLMPAFDGRVRRGLQRGGFDGMHKTQYLLPDDMHGADWRKISRLPFLLGECWITYAPQITAGVSRSRYPALLNEPGRVFDVLFFMQGDPRRKIIASYQGPQKWYDLP